MCECIENEDIVFWNQLIHIDIMSRSPLDWEIQINVAILKIAISKYLYVFGTTFDLLIV